MGALVPTGQGGVDAPIGVVLDQDQNLYVTSRDTDQVLRYGPAAQAAFTIRLDSPLASLVTVQFTTAPGTALAGSDYVTTSGTITFAPGQTSRTILVQTVNDGTAEPIESFVVNLSNPTNATIADGQGVGTITDDDGPTKFFVVDDGSPDRTYRYDAPGTGIGNNALAVGNTAPRGVATTTAGSTVWVVDANKTVYVYNAAGALQGSWTAGGLNANAQVEGITTNGTDVWLVDNNQNRVYKYTGAASLLSGNLNASSSFALNKNNSNPKDLVTDGTSIWVVNDGTPDYILKYNKVFKYSLTGSLLGSWHLDNGNTQPTGITLDPSNGQQHLWVVDSGTDRVYQYTNARSRTSGSQSAAVTFALAAGNTNPQGIADPPAGLALDRKGSDRGRLRTREASPVATQLPAVYFAPDVFDFSPIAVDKPRGHARRI